MILLFLGSWRSTLIVAVSIPLSILTSILVLSALHETINVMTHGSLALAVGILVDDATVEIENVNRILNQGKEIREAILEGAQQIAVPALVSTLCISIVFIPMFFLDGVARYLFVPLAEVVAFAMMASYILSRTLVPTGGTAAPGIRCRLHRATGPIRPASSLHRDCQVLAGLHTELLLRFNTLSRKEWLERHGNVSPEEFERNPERNRLTVLLGRTSHAWYHFGQMMLAKQKTP
jgi:hypothetical protein